MFFAALGLRYASRLKREKSYIQFCCKLIRFLPISQHLFIVKWIIKVFQWIMLFLGVMFDSFLTNQVQSHIFEELFLPGYRVFGQKLDTLSGSEWTLLVNNWLKNKVCLISVTTRFHWLICWWRFVLEKTMTSSASVISKGVYHQSFCTYKCFFHWSIVPLALHTSHLHSLMSCVFSTVFIWTKNIASIASYWKTKIRLTVVLEL